MKNLIEKARASRWLPWLGAAPFILIPLYVGFQGDVWRAFGLFCFFGSVWVGLILGGKGVDLFQDQLSQHPDGFAQRIRHAGCAFGMLTLPPLVAAFTNRFMGTEIALSSFGTHALGAVVAAGIVFLAAPDSEDK